LISILILVSESNLDDAKSKEGNFKYDENEEYCKFHPYNQGKFYYFEIHSNLKNIVHILCTTCNEVICDKCELLNHKDHEREQLNLQNNDNFLVKIMQNFLEKIKNSNDGKFKDFNGKVDEIESLVESFFEAEIKKVERLTGEVVDLLQNLILKIQRLISMYKMKFKEQFNSIKGDYKKFCTELENCKFYFLS